MKKELFYEINNPYGNLFIKNFEACLDELIIISFNSNYIYIPNVITFQNNKLKFRNFLNQLVNLGIEIIEVENSDTFQNMIDAIIFYSKNKNIIKFKSQVLPFSDIYLNIDNLIKTCIFFKISPKSIIVNDTFFTTSESEFHGTGLFINKKSYLIGQEEYDIIKKSLESNI